MYFNGCMSLRVGDNDEEKFGILAMDSWYDPIEFIIFWLYN